MCEGETEKNYFQAIKEDPDYKQALSAIHPKVVVAKHPTPDKVVEEAISRAEKESRQGNPYEKVWVVFDHDNNANRQDAYKTAINESYSVAFTAIAFEVWYLLHYIKSARAFTNGSQVVATLRNHYPNYEKAKQNDFAILKPKLSDALENAVWLRAQVKEDDKTITDHNPWTDVDVLVKELIESNENGF